jgi:hypothetical protein
MWMISLTSGRRGRSLSRTIRIASALKTMEEPISALEAVASS